MRVFEAILHELNKLLREKCAISQKKTGGKISIYFQESNFQSLLSNSRT